MLTLQNANARAGPAIDEFALASLADHIFFDGKFLFLTV